MSEPDVPGWITDAMRGLAAVGGGTTDEQIAEFRERCRRYDTDPDERARIDAIAAGLEEDDGA